MNDAKQFIIDLRKIADEWDLDDPEEAAMIYERLVVWVEGQRRAGVEEMREHLQWAMGRVDIFFCSSEGDSDEYEWTCIVCKSKASVQSAVHHKADCKYAAAIRALSPAPVGEK